jgi:hypothetical protein
MDMAIWSMAGRSNDSSSPPAPSHDRPRAPRSVISGLTSIHPAFGNSPMNAVRMPYDLPMRFCLSHTTQSTHARHVRSSDLPPQHI